MADFIGRGEMLTREILLNPFGIENIASQVNIKALIKLEDFQILQNEWKQHNFDLVIYRKNRQMIAVEVNYKHGEKAARKGFEFEKMLNDNNVLYMKIDDYDCRNLFRLDTKQMHKKSWDDLRDIIDSFEKAKIEC